MLSAGRRSVRTPDADADREPVASVIAGEEHELIGPLMEGLGTDLLPRDDRAAECSGCGCTRWTSDRARTARVGSRRFPRSEVASVSVCCAMSIVHTKIGIDAPIERVWETVMDPKRSRDWVTIHRESARCPTNRSVKGQRWSRSSTCAASRSECTGRWLTSASRTRAEWEGRGPAHSVPASVTSSRQTRTVRPFQYTNEFQCPAGVSEMSQARVIVGAASEREANEVHCRA